MEKDEGQLTPQMEAAVKRVSAIFRKVRSENGWSQDAVATEADMQLSKYARLEQGAGDVRMSALIEAFSGFGLDFVEVVRSALGSVAAADVGKLAGKIQRQDHVLKLAQDQLEALHEAKRSASVIDIIGTMHSTLPVPRIRAGPKSKTQGGRVGKLQEAANKGQKKEKLTGSLR